MISASPSASTKFRALSQATRQSADFLRAYRKEDHPLALFLRRTKYDASPDFQVYTHACTTLGAVLEARGVDSDDLFASYGSNLIGIAVR